MASGYKELVPSTFTMNLIIILLSGLCHYVSTQEFGDLRLADGPSPNMGRVEMYLGSRGWFTTCDPTWDILDAIVVCRQLGFPGAAHAHASASYKAIGIPLARSVKCTGYESRLKDCPYHTTKICTSAVSVICQEPGYIGCYDDEPSDSIFRDGRDTSPVMDLAQCKAFCRQKGAMYVGLKNHNECYCAKNGDLLPTHERLADSACQISCAGNSKEICGGVTTKGHYVVSVHHMYTSECTRLNNPANGYILDTEYSFGQDVRYRCSEGFTLDGSETLRCVLKRGAIGADGLRVKWNASEPVCVVRPFTPITNRKVWLPTRGTTGRHGRGRANINMDITTFATTETPLSLTLRINSGNAKSGIKKVLADKPGLVLVLALIVVFALCTPVFTFIVLRRHCARRKMLIDAKAEDPEKHSYQDLLYNPRYAELNSASYEPLRPPRKRDALRSEKTKTAPSALDMDPYTSWQQQEFGLKSEPIYQCSNSMNNLVIGNGDTHQINNLRNGVISNYYKKEDNDVTRVYSNANTLNFKKHMTSSFRKELDSSSFRKENINNRRNQELKTSQQTNMNKYEEEDDGDYAVI